MKAWFKGFSFYITTIESLDQLSNWKRDMPRKEIIITEEGLEKLKNELAELRDVRRPEIINRIKTAKELGDLSENAEYSSAKEDQSFVEGRIQELEEIIKHAKVTSSTHKETIGVGSQVEFEVDGEKDAFEIVGPAESDPEKGKIASDSPVGRALLGHKAKDSVKVETPDGSVTYKILKIA